MKEIHRTFRLTKKEEDILIDCSKIKNQNISDFLRFLINQKKDIFNCKKEDLIFFHSRFSKILSSALSLNFNVRNINKRFIKNKSVVISEEEKIQIINSISNIDLFLESCNCYYYDIFYLDFFSKFFFKKSFIRFKFNLIVALHESDYENFNNMVNNSTITKILLDILKFVFIFITSPLWLIYKLLKSKIK